MREHWLGKPRGERLPVHVPVIIPGPCRGLQAQLGPWDPACDRHGMDHQQTWPLARWFVAPGPLFFQIPGKLPCMVLVHEGVSEGNCRPLQAAIGGAMRSFLPQVASSCEDNILAFFQGRTSLPGAIRQAPALQCPPQRHGRESGRRGLDEILPQLPPTDPLACSMLGPYLRTHAGLEMHGRTLLGVPTRLRSLGLEGVPMVTILSQNALDRDVSHIEALGCAQWGIPGRYCLRVLPLLIKMECEGNDQWFHGWSKILPLKRHSSALPVGVEHGAACRYRYQRVRGEVEEGEKFFVSSHMKNAIDAVPLLVSVPCSPRI
jgi:hypothetical protein